MAVENSYTQQRQVEGPSGKGVSHGFAVVFWPKQGLSVQYRSIPPSSGQISPHGVKWAGQLNFSTCDNEPESRWPETAHSNKRQPKEKSLGHDRVPLERHRATLRIESQDLSTPFAYLRLERRGLEEFRLL